MKLTYVSYFQKVNHKSINVVPIQIDIGHFVLVDVSGNLRLGVK